MPRIILATLIALYCFIFLLPDSPADEPKDPPKKPARIAIADPEEAAKDPDFAIQGEYEGHILGKEEKLGVQVIAKGAGKFELRVYNGGLPGAGWDGKAPLRGIAKRTGEEPRIEPTTVDEKTSLGILNQASTGKMIFTYSYNRVDAGLSKVERKSKTLGDKPPEGAVVLFGTEGDEKNWDNGRLLELPDGKFLTVAKVEVDGKKQGGDIRSKEKFGAFKAHIEFRLPWMPNSSGQDRGNSGVYIQDRYECQLLDSFGLKGENNECGGIYQQHKPSVNMCLPPLAWQTYDIEFTPAVFEDGKKVKNARATIYHNGVKIHDDIELAKATPGGKNETDTPGPFQFQDHGDPVVFRNVWVVPVK